MDAELTSPSYQFFDDTLIPEKYLVSFKLAKVVALCWLFVLLSFLHVFYSDEFDFFEDPLHFDDSVNTHIVEFLSSHQVQLQISSMITFFASITYFSSLSVWILLLEDIGSYAIFAASLLQLLGPISAILQLVSMLIMIILCTADPSPSDFITILFFIQALCFQISFSFFGIISCALGASLVNIKKKKCRSCGEIMSYLCLFTQLIFSILFVGVFLKNGLLKLPYDLCSVIWYMSTILTAIVAFLEVCWLLLYNPDMYQLIKYEDMIRTTDSNVGP